jgi:hypothetical protein
MTEIFISYASEDRERAAGMAQVFEERGWSVWWDRRIPPGRDYAEVIEAALKAARCVVVLWTEAAIASKWVRTEAAEAADRGVLVPALLDEVAIPFEFKRLQAARMIGWRCGERPPDLAQLLASIASLLDPTVIRPATAADPIAAGAARRAEPPRAVRRGFAGFRKPLVLAGVGFCWLAFAGLLVQYASHRLAGDVVLESSRNPAGNGDGNAPNAEDWGSGRAQWKSGGMEPDDAPAPDVDRPLAVRPLAVRPFSAVPVGVGPDLAR